MRVQTSWETNDEIKQIFPLVSDVDVEKTCFLCEVKTPYE